MTDSVWNLRGREALVTGGSRGIGRAIAEEFLALGARVTIVAHTRDAVAIRSPKADPTINMFGLSLAFRRDTRPAP